MLVRTSLEEISQAGEGICARTPSPLYVTHTHAYVGIR